MLFVLHMGRGVNEKGWTRGGSKSKTGAIGWGIVMN